MPASTKEIVDPSGLAAHVHEQTHFFQAMTTLTGVGRLAGWWRIMSEVSDFLTRERLRLPRELDANDMRQAYAEYMDVQNDLAELLRITPPLSGPHRVSAEERNVAGFAIPDGDVATFVPYGAHTLQESMAMAMEVWREVDCGTYEQAAKRRDHWFRYAAAGETVATLLGRGPDLWWVTILLCDLALDHIVPHLAFWQMVDHLRERGHGLPPFAALPELHAELIELTRLNEVEEDRARLLEVADYWSEQGGGSDDVFDQAIGRLFQAAAAGLRKRQSDAMGLLQDYLSAPVASGLLDDFALPLYVSGTRLISQTDDTRLRDAILFLHLASHRAEVVLGVREDVGCPLTEILGGCDWPRVNACHQAPWQRDLDDEQQACTYRYVSHGLENAVVHDESA